MNHESTATAMIKRNWKTDWLPGVAFQVAATPAEALRIEPALSADILRPAFGTDKPDAFPAERSDRPELSGALAAVGQAARLIKAAQDRAERAEEEARTLRAENDARLSEMEAQLRDAQDRFATAERTLLLVTSRTEEALAHADAEIESARGQVKLERDRAHDQELRTAERLNALESRLKDADDRVFAAETRAMEAKEDLVYVEAMIRENFGILPVAVSSDPAAPVPPPQAVLAALEPSAA